VLRALLGWSGHSADGSGVGNLGSVGWRIHRSLVRRFRLMDRLAGGSKFSAECRAWTLVDLNYVVSFRIFRNFSIFLVSGGCHLEEHHESESLNEDPHENESVSLAGEADDVVQSTNKINS